MKGFNRFAWAALALLGASCLGTIALRRGETINALWIVVAAVSIYLVAYRYYALFIASRVLQLDPMRATPAVTNNDGLDYVRTNKHVLFGHHFAAIAGAGPLVGPVLAAQMGYLPGLLWLVVGVVFAGARPFGGAVARLLGQLAHGAGKRRFRRVDLARGEFEHHAPHRVAVLALEHEAAVGQQRHDHHRAGVDDVLAHRGRAVGQAHEVAPHVQEVALVDLGPRQSQLAQLRVGVGVHRRQRRRGAHGRPVSAAGAGSARRSPGRRRSGT